MSRDGPKKEIENTGENVVITRNGKPVVLIRPVEESEFELKTTRIKSNYWRITVSTAPQYPILSYEHSEPKKFVDFWSKFYTYPEEHLYSDSIEKEQLSFADIENLYKWKNGGNLSQKKETSLREKIISAERLKVINYLKTNFDLNKFQQDFGDVSTIWKIFLLHIIAPRKYPIFDQHVYRAYYFLSHQEIRELPVYNPKKERIYFDEYLVFFKEFLEKTDCLPKKLDEALWALGKFLKTQYGMTLTEGRRLKN